MVYYAYRNIVGNTDYDFHLFYKDIFMTLFFKIKIIVHIDKFATGISKHTKELIKALTNLTV